MVSPPFITLFAGLVQFLAAGRALTRTVRNYFVTIFRGYVNRRVQDLVSIFYRSSI